MSFNPTYTSQAMKWVFNVSTPTPLSDWYVSLHGGPVGTSGANEIVGGGWYSRQRIRWESISETAGADVGDNSFPPSTSPIPLILRHFGIWSSRSGGNFYFGGSLDKNPQTLGPGESLAWFSNGIQAYFVGRTGSALSSNLAAWFLGLSPSRPSSYVVGLHYADPGSNGDNEFFGGGYSRGSISFSGSVENSGIITIGSPASPAWNPLDLIRYFTIWGDGDFLVSGSMASIAPPRPNQIHQIQAGDLTVGLS